MTKRTKVTTCTALLLFFELFNTVAVLSPFNSLLRHFLLSLSYEAPFPVLFDTAQQYGHRPG